MIWIIGDIHGCYKTFLTLLDKIYKKDSTPKIYLLGDYIDRGPRSCEVINYLLNNKNKDIKGFLKGNHEDLMTKYFRRHYEGKYWLKNGGKNTLKSYENYYKNKTDKEIIDIIIKDSENLYKLPSYIILDNVIDNNNKKLLLSHAPSLGYINLFIKQKTKILEEEFLWNREYPLFNNTNYFNITGHNIVDYFFKEKEGYIIDKNIIINKKLGFAAIDTGCFINTENEIGKLTALSFPEFEIVQVKNID